MNIQATTWLATASLLGVLICGEARADSAEAAEVILPSDARFNVFELSNAAGGGTFASSDGTVLMSFVSKDSRYCRAARFRSDYSFVLACRDERGWNVEAKSQLAAGESTATRVLGGGDMSAVADAVERLRAAPDFLDELEVIEAAGKGWRNPVPVDKQSWDARQILERVGQVYRASKSYIDTGTVQTVYKTQPGARTAETNFKTAYVAPDDFRFESSMGDFGSFKVGFIAWLGKNGVKTWTSLKNDPFTDVDSIQSALDGAAGISRDTSGMIPGLFFPGTRLGGDIIRLTSAVRLADEQIDGFDCFQVQGSRWPNTGQPTTVWIDRNSFLIRRVYEEAEIRQGMTETTWFYQPAMNVPVEDDALRHTEPTLK